MSVVPDLSRMQRHGIEFLGLEDDGLFPNSPLPVVIHREVFQANASDLGQVMEERFHENNWTRSWRDGVYSFHHYHSTTHEVLGFFQGSAVLKLGGENGQEVSLGAGDVVVIPAGVAHKCLQCSDDFGVVGAYPEGREADLLRDGPDDRAEAERNLPDVPLPSTDPVFGRGGPLIAAWTESNLGGN